MSAVRDLTESNDELSATICTINDKITKRLARLCFYLSIKLKDSDAKLNLTPGPP